KDKRHDDEVPRPAGLQERNEPMASVKAGSLAQLRDIRLRRLELVGRDLVQVAAQVGDEIAALPPRQVTQLPRHLAEVVVPGHARPSCSRAASMRFQESVPARYSARPDV